MRKYLILFLATLLTLAPVSYAAAPINKGADCLISFSGTVVSDGYNPYGGYGQPVSTMNVELYHYNGSTWDIVTSVSTNTAGVYYLPPVWGVGGAYKVRAIAFTANPLTGVFNRKSYIIDAVCGTDYEELDWLYNWNDF